MGKKTTQVMKGIIEFYMLANLNLGRIGAYPRWESHRLKARLSTFSAFTYNDFSNNME